jgi:hypothetical protein
MNSGFAVEDRLCTFECSAPRCKSRSKGDGLAAANAVNSSRFTVIDKMQSSPAHLQ